MLDCVEQHIAYRTALLGTGYQVPTESRHAFFEVAACQANSSGGSLIRGRPSPVPKPDILLPV